MAVEWLTAGSGNRSKQPLIRALKASPAVMIDYVEATRSRRIGGMLTVSV